MTATVARDLRSSFHPRLALAVAAGVAVQSALIGGLSWWRAIESAKVAAECAQLCWLWTIAGCSALWHVCVIAGPPVVAGSLVACEREIA